MVSAEDKILLGIDTGGTYTDAVLFSDGRGVLAKAKSLTTKHDLSVGISGAVDAVLSQFQGNTDGIRLVSISTTLATNALVEGKGGSIALVMIGFDEADMEKAGLREALGNDPVIFIPGGHDVNGNERPLDMSCLDEFVTSHKQAVSGFAVAGYFAVRNASHEMKVRDFLAKHADLPVTCSHELSSKLGGPKRALTTILNARLIPVIQRLIHACRSHLEMAGIAAPLMVVRGDGTLVDADFALTRPIETILSGPAASLIGAKFLLGSKDAIVSDIGGTTTDIAILDKGWPRIDAEGAQVGGYSTMVEAVAMYTFGLGGDSAVSIDANSPTGLSLGPRRQIPASLLAVTWPDIVLAELNRQLKLDTPGQHNAQFVMRSREMADRVGKLKTSEQKLYDRLSDEPQALDKFLKSASEQGTLKRLVSRGLAQLAGFTPSDAMHVLEAQNNWNSDAAIQAARVFAKIRDRFGQPIAIDPQELARRVKLQLTFQSVDAILATCMKEDGLTIGPGAGELLRRALDKTSGFVRFALSLDRPLVGLGASASTYYPAIGEMLTTECIVPGDADVANAIGAVTSEVRISKSIVINSGDGGNSFYVMLPAGPSTFANEDAAIFTATENLKQQVLKLAEEAGAADAQVDKRIEIDAPEIEGSRCFVQARIYMTATGRPNFS